jgi:hypothetical protein
MTNQQIAWLRLVNQHLLNPSATRPQDVVSHLVAMQAQDYLGAKWAIGLRMQNATDEIVEQAVNDGSILRTHLLRPTWHFVTPEDIRWLLMLTAPRVQAINAFIYRQVGLDAATFARSNKAIARALEGRQYRTREQLREKLEQVGIHTEGTPRMNSLLMHAELEGLICSGPRSGNHETYALMEERVPKGKMLSRDEALVELVGRYFRSRGPATAQDFTKWLGLTVTDARKGLEAHQASLESETVDGNTYWFPPNSAATNLLTGRGIHLLSIYDEYISAYEDHSAIRTPEIAAKLSALGASLTHIAAVGGTIRGVWSRTFRKTDVLVNLNFVAPMPNQQIRAVNTAVKRYGEFWGKAIAAE